MVRLMPPMTKVLAIQPAGMSWWEREATPLRRPECVSLTSLNPQPGTLRKMTDEDVAEQGQRTTKEEPFQYGMLSIDQRTLGLNHLESLTCIKRVLAGNKPRVYNLPVFDKTRDMRGRST